MDDEWRVQIDKASHGLNPIYCELKSRCDKVRFKNRPTTSKRK